LGDGVIEEERPDKPANQDSGNGAPEPQLTEPFPCPYCGQMLAPNCRVCVACKAPIHPAHLARLQPAVVSPPAPEAAVEAKAEPPLGFPGRAFVIFLAVWIVVVSIVLDLVGPLKGQLVLGGVQMLTALWVFYDAYEKRLPKPLRWGVGALFLWVIVFPWYLVRRTRPNAPCPFVEGPAGPMTRALLLILLVVFIILILRGTIKP
jgi:hypothetical protein